MFSHISALDVWIMGIYVVVVLVADFAIGLVGARWGGAGWKSVWWGIVGFVAGSFLIPMPVFGSLVGMFLGVFVSELGRTRNAGQAQRAALGSFAGWLAGMGFKAVAIVVFVIMFVVMALV